MEGGQWAEDQVHQEGHCHQEDGELSTSLRGTTQLYTLLEGEDVMFPTQRLMPLPPQVKMNKNVRVRRAWAKFGDCKEFEPGHKESGVVMIAEPVS